MRGTGGAIAAAVLMATSFGWGQRPNATSAQPQTQPQTQAQMPAQPQASAENDPAKEDSRTLKQKLLDDQAQRLVTMANELKAAVDKTNKNILSLDVVRKAEQIELLAHKMKDQGKR